MRANNHHIYDAAAFDKHLTSFADQFHDEIAAFTTQCGACVYDEAQRKVVAVYNCRACRRKTKHMRESFAEMLETIREDLERSEAALNHASDKAGIVDRADEETLNEHDLF